MDLNTNPLLRGINQICFFDEFSSAEKKTLVERSGIFKKYEKQGVKLIKEGGKGKSLFVIMEGVINITRVSFKGDLEKRVLLATLKKGSVFGEISLLTDSKRTTTAITASSLVIVMEVDEKILESFDLSIQKLFQKQMILTLVSRLDNMNKKYIDAIS